MFVLRIFYCGPETSANLAFEVLVLGNDAQLLLTFHSFNRVLNLVDNFLVFAELETVPARKMLCLETFVPVESVFLLFYRENGYHVVLF